MPWPVGVEGVEIHRGALGQLLDLTLAQPLPGGPRHRGGRVGERAPHAFDRRQPAQPVGVLLCRKVQHGISRVQVGVSAVTVGHPPDPDRPEHGGQPALTVRLGALARHPVGVDHLGESGLALRPHLQMSLKQLPQQLPAVHGKPCLQHIVGQPCRFLTAQPRHHRLEATTRLAERIIRRLRRVSFHSGLLLHVLVQAPMNVGRRGPFVSPSTTPDTPATGVFGLPQQSRTLMELSVAGSPTCLAGLRCAVRSSLQELPAAIPGEVVDDLVLAVSEAATNAILYRSRDAQPVEVTIRVQGGGIEATIRDRGRPHPVRLP